MWLILVEMKGFRKFSLALAFSVAVLAAPALAAAPAFDEVWLEQLRQEAIQSGVRGETVQKHLYDIYPLEHPVAAQKSQAEFKHSLAEYLSKRVTPYNIETGSRKRDENTAALEKMQQIYGVPPQYVMAIWALESAYGRFTGDQDTIPVLVTLARDHPRKAAGFRREAIEALKMIDDGYTQVFEKKSSWAGAMGQTQFMPSSFRHYGADGDGDGKIDIWDNLPDVFASTANHMVKSGWRSGERWGREVNLPEGFNRQLLSDNLRTQKNRTPDQWAKLGVTQKDGSPLPADDTMQGMLIAPDGPGGRAFLVYENFRVIMRYNSSYNYALSVCFLADAIAAHKSTPQPAPGVN